VGDVLEQLEVLDLIWSKKSGSSRQLDDVAGILKNGFDAEYVGQWVAELGLQEEFDESKRRTEIRSVDGHDT